MVELALLLLAVLYEGLDLSNLVGHLHHAPIGDLTGSVNCTVLQILPQTDYHRVERKCKQQLLLKVIVNLLNHKAVLVGHTLLELQRTDVVLDVLRVLEFHLFQVNQRVSDP